MQSRALAVLGLLALTVVLGPVAAWAQSPDDQADLDVGPALTAVDGFTQKDLEDAFAEIEASETDPDTNPDGELGLKGSPLLDLLRTLGLIVFTTPFNTFDGLGDGPFVSTEVPPLALGHRPTLQGNGLHLRISGLDAQSCNECHSLVSHATVPPVLGIGGAGTVAESALPAASMIDVADSFDDRVQYVSGHDPDLPLTFDGVADFNGRFINAPFLFGGGGVELVAKEMTARLQKLLDDAQGASAGTIVSLDVYGVNFGYVLSLGGGNVELHHEGIGPEDITGLTPEEVLVVRPFGRKGDAFTMRDFDRNAMAFHFGMQPVEVVGAGVDEDIDGHVNEITVAEMTLLHLFDVTNPAPVTDELDDAAEAGREVFKAVGCDTCHVPEINTRRRKLPISFPEIDTDPWANVYYNVKLTDFGFSPTVYGGGVVVPMYSDLKRHYMGPDLAETCESCEIANGDFITARLWGIADTAPYMHDGRATTLRQAIDMHGGEALPVRNAYFALPAGQQLQLVHFLRHLRTPENPNEDILP